MEYDMFYWLNRPRKFEFMANFIKIRTEPETDFWQRTHYGFSKTNAPAFLTKTNGNLTFSVRTLFNTQKQYDQCGVLLYVDEENWLKISVEHENETFARLGSVVTNLGYSDWATADISFPVTEMSYRLSIKNQDVKIEYAEKDNVFRQMRILHMHKLLQDAGIGIYACSPLDSSFEAGFTDISIIPE